MSFSLKKAMVLFSVLLLSNYSFSQDSYWKPIQHQKSIKANRSPLKALPAQSQVLQLNYKAFTEVLHNAPARNLSSKSREEPLLIEFPDAEGTLQLFRVMESSVMSKELQAKFPNIKSFVGQGVNNPAISIHFSLSKTKGLSAMILTNQKTVFIEPYDLEDHAYVSYVNSAEDYYDESFVCLTESDPGSLALPKKESSILKNANDGQLRTFRMALACTVEYAQFHIEQSNLDNTATDTQKKAAVLAAMNTTMTRVNGIYERDLGVTMELVPNNDELIFLGPDVNTDPYTNNSDITMLGENQTTCDDIIGSANYDIGHVFSTGGGGRATLRSACKSTKARGVTGLSSPVADKFDVDYVAHEIGHQFGANHTQNNDCQRSVVSVEPGSASTIMGYAGICAPNIQNNSDDYFNAVSIEEMWLNIINAEGANCGAESSTGNTAPTANAGPDYYIPKLTPFVLKGTATDSDGDNLTYTWEQNDPQPAPMPPQPTSVEGPLFRSLPPSASPNRYMPAFNTVLSGNFASEWEVLPAVGRTMNFTLTVRDNSPIAGSTSSDDVVINTLDTETAFQVLTPPTLAPGSTQTIKWILGESNQFPINCSLVNIYFAENGTNFNTLLAEHIPNDGSADVVIPNISNATGVRIMVEADDNIFYSVTEPFDINTNPDFEINVMNNPQIASCGQDMVLYELDYSTSNGFSDPVSFLVNGPQNANFNFTPSSISSEGKITLGVSNLTQVSPGDYDIQIIAQSTNFSKSVIANLSNLSAGCSSSGNTDYNTGTTGVIINDGSSDVLSNTNNGKPSAYSDFTDIITNLVIDNQYDLTINVDSDGDFTVATRVWIDWNQNCSFDDPGEQYDLGSTTHVSNGATSNSPLAFTIPANAALGTTLMRVSTKFQSAADACDNDYDGEVEDYTLNVVTSLSQTDFSIEDLKIYPNPNHGRFNIQFQTPIQTEFEIQVFSIQGKSIYKKAYDVFGRFDKTLDLGQLSSGLYLIQIKDGFQTMTKKLIIK